MRNLSSHTLEYYRENLYYIQRILKLDYADELTKDKVDELIDHELDKGNKVGAINTRTYVIPERMRRYELGMPIREVS